MIIVKSVEGKLKMSVSSEGNFIPEGTPVVVETVVDNFKNMFFRVVSIKTSVRLSHFETNSLWLV